VTFIFLRAQKNKGDPFSCAQKNQGDPFFCARGRYEFFILAGMRGPSS
jgi:hypothetical protein